MLKPYREILEQQQYDNLQIDGEAMLRSLPPGHPDRPRDIDGHYADKKLYELTLISGSASYESGGHDAGGEGWGIVWAVISDDGIWSRDPDRCHDCWMVEFGSQGLDCDGPVSFADVRYSLGEPTEGGWQPKLYYKDELIDALTTVQA